MTGDESRFTPVASADAVRLRPLRILARPWIERSFVLDGYERLLESLADESRFLVVPLRELGSAPRDRVVVGLRHDVDERLANAMEMAALEHRYGLPATYFILHTARYYGKVGWRRAGHREALIPALKRLQDMGHEVGWHNDLVTLECVHGIEPKAYLEGELAWLRGHGIEVRGSASHGSYWAHRLGYHNNYFFEDFPEAVERHPNTEVVQVGERRCTITKARLADFGLEYEAYHLHEDHYFSDARFDTAGIRWHPDDVDLERLRPGERAIFLLHPDIWDPSVGRKAVRNVGWSARKLVTGERMRRPG